jgi:hypothetical protein
MLKRTLLETGNLIAEISNFTPKLLGSSTNRDLKPKLETINDFSGHFGQTLLKHLSERVGPAIAWAVATRCCSHEVRL